VLARASAGVTGRATDARAVYVTTDDGMVARVRKDGVGGPRTLVAGRSHPRDLVRFGSTLAWAERALLNRGATGVFHMPASGGAVEAWGLDPKWSLPGALAAAPDTLWLTYDDCIPYLGRAPLAGGAVQPVRDPSA
jgi:hypothetical protein